MKLTPIGYFIASQLFIELVEGLQYLHKENIIHRDLKPSNILLKNGFLNSNLLERDYKRRFLKISDFGLLALHRFSQQTHSLDKGTPKYMAPEVIYNEKYGFEADIYSIGVILTQLLIIDMSRYEQ
jgi:serine/threonine protein kinase